MKINNYIFLGIESLGVVVIFFVWLALTSVVITFPMNTQVVALSLYGMFIFATGTAVLTLSRSSSWVTYRALTLCGITLLVMGASIPYIIPEYFHWAVDLNQWYWLRVSVYSIPAICIEGAIYTLFIVLYENGLGQRTDREKLLLLLGVVVYSIVTVTTNFMSINRTISVDAHIGFTKIVVAIVLIVTLVLILFRKKLHLVFPKIKPF